VFRAYDRRRGQHIGRHISAPVGSAAELAAMRRASCYGGSSKRCGRALDSFFAGAAGPIAMLAPRMLRQTTEIFRIVGVIYGPMARLIYCAPFVWNVGPTRRRPIPRHPAARSDKA
jgi:hypothetical protein